MEKNIDVVRKKRRWQSRQQWLSGTPIKRETNSSSINGNMGVNAQDQVVNAESLSISSESPFILRPVQFITYRYREVSWHPVDLICLLYTCLVNASLLFFHKNVDNCAQILLTNSLLIVAVPELLRMVSSRSNNRFLSFIRVVYPAVFLSWGWSSLNDLVPIFFGNYWATELIIAADKFIFGVHPTVWVQQFHNPLLDELMCSFYTGYYLYMPAIISCFFFCGKKKQALDIFSFAAFAYFANFICFYFFPAVGPQMVDSLDGFGVNTYSGYYVADLLRYIQDNGSVAGAAFPSTHISGAIIWSLATKRYAPKWGNVLLTFSIGVAISTVYLGYHHAMDPIFGFILAIVCYYIGLFIFGKQSIKSSKTKGG